MRIAVTGATGHLGRLVIDDLLERGMPAGQVVAVVRDTGKAGDLADRGGRRGAAGLHLHSEGRHHPAATGRRAPTSAETNTGVPEAVEWRGPPVLGHHREPVVTDSQSRLQSSSHLVAPP